MKRLLIFTLTCCMLLGCKSPEARRPVSVKTGSFIDASVERNKKLNKAERNKILELIKKDSSSEYIASENGFWYRYDTKIEEESITPEFGDIVSFNYEVSDLNGNTIYSEEELKTKNYAMDKEELFSGLREGLKLMKAGETVTFLFPSQKAFGYYGDSNKIGTNIPLICNVTINTITQKETN
ncbi:gliding motility-associated peptidyl-prolyl isomerase GldI [Pontimicrobium aquaticum]|uniref:Peptidyl-prolyl cis-trans isomerase n=1 Tax=Pontimicrobium aquaticum TaxID=2565367 RepID=A0A4V5LQS3_9FLAO|nr:gliding motility-associated peptidyl-prolyl isomerase GldI [Pontimicrobium aquaticum]TJY36279.1 gliding motility-associated peptidyl-prolyl isomerase GldI [Pontimicrobium aquaticum]